MVPCFYRIASLTPLLKQGGCGSSLLILTAAAHGWIRIVPEAAHKRNCADPVSDALDHSRRIQAGVKYPEEIPNLGYSGRWNRCGQRCIDLFNALHSGKLVDENAAQKLSKFPLIYD